MFLYIKTNILRGYGIFKNDFAHPREPATKIKIYYNVKLNLIKCEQLAPAPATRLFVLAATARDELWQPHF